MKKGFFLTAFIFVLTAPAPFALGAGAGVTKGELRPDRIVLITIDTLRADHLSVYGYPRKTSPFMDSLAGSGVLFCVG